ncbi:MAG: hypothetical protein ABI700_17125 [Chloroflexota bacterium]
MQLLDKMPALEQFGNVAPDGYRYYEKIVTAQDDLSLPRAYLKWYDLYPAEDAITEAQREESRAFLAAEAERLKLDHELGFVILHRAGQYLLLMLMTWRNTNEIWESVYVKDVTQVGGYRLNEFENSHRGTYCVWELGIVWHERDAWVRFLSSERDNAAKLAYINDRFAGRV